VKNVTAEKMREMDKKAIREYGIPSLVLMENAGRGSAEIALNMLGGKNKKTVIICGKGNNGGDGFVCARHLLNRGIDTEIFLIGDPAALSEGSRVNFGILNKMKAKIKLLNSVKSAAFFAEKIKGAGLLIDAIFGIGLSSEIKEPYLSVIKEMNASGKPILSLDVPSGLDATTGDLLGICVKAKRTATFALPKTGFVKKKGPLYTGKVDIVDISMPKCLL